MTDTSWRGVAEVDAEEAAERETPARFAADRRFIVRVGYGFGRGAGRTSRACTSSRRRWVSVDGAGAAGT